MGEPEQRVSIVTAAMHGDRLAQVYRSLQMQSVDTWEWVIVPCGPLRVPDEIAADHRVQVLSAGPLVGAAGVPTAKKRGVEHAGGSVVVDLDPDDELADAGALATLFAAGDGVRYGDVLVRLPGGLPAEYGTEYGWQHASPGTVADIGESATVVRAFDPDAAALHLSAYSPKHALMWPREVYLALGGHRSEAGAEADFDLLCRAYVAGTPVTHVDACTAVTHRRAHVPADTNLAQNVSNGHVYALIRAWCERSGLPMLDMGAAHNPAPGFTSVDLHGAEINCDIRFGLPVPDGSVGCIRAQDFLEHMNRCPDSTCQHGEDGEPRCAVGVMNDFYRALAPGGWLISGTPSSDGRGAFQDPTHVSFWNPNSFWYYTRHEQARFVPGIRCRFQAMRLWQGFPNEWHRQHNIPYVYADLVALKGQRSPGRSEWPRPAGT